MGNITRRKLPGALAVAFVASAGFSACKGSVDGAPMGVADGDSVPADNDDQGSDPQGPDDQGDTSAVTDTDPTPTGPPTSAGCANGQGLAEGAHTFTLDGLTRRYVVRLPAGYTRDSAWPLVLALPGNGSTTSYWDGTTGVRNIRDVLHDDAVLIIAEAIDQQWRDYAQASTTWPARITQELAYFEEVLSQARASLCLREDGVFAMGFSGGGSFAGVLACSRDDIRAIAVGGSVIYFDQSTCAAHTAAWISISEGDQSTDRTAYRDVFRSRAGCESTSTPTTPSGCVAYDGCDTGAPVHYCDYPGGHEWATFGSEAMWSFFSGLLE